MKVDDVFNAAVAIAREVVDERTPGEKFPIDELYALRDGSERQGRAPDLADIRSLIDKVAAPYRARIAELEAIALKVPELMREYAKLESENKSLREAARAMIAVHDNLPTSPSLKQCAKAIDDLTNPVCAMIALIEGAS